MIKLTLNSDFHPSKHVFHKTSLTIGSSGADLALPDEQLFEIHVKIIEDEGKFFVINVANDPFVALNDRPFGKKEIRTGDHLSVRDDILLFEGRLEDKRKISCEDVRKKEKVPHCAVKLKKSALFKSKKFLLSSILTVFLILILSIGGVYFRINERNRIQELNAAEGVADVAMALTYAKLQRENVQKMNFTDPNFLNRMIQSVVSDQITKPSFIDLHGQLRDSSFIVRIYACSDLNHFLVIAQPEPSLLHWFLQKKAIVIDSSTMELRRTGSLNEINRQLVNLDVYSGSKAEEISAFVNQQELISLSKLAKRGNAGFDVPAQLAEMQPGSENHVYNAPRYYGLGQEFLEQALHILDHAKNSKEIGVLKKQLDVMKDYPNFVFYTPSGKEKALEGLKAFNTISPFQGFLVGFVELNQKGQILKTALIDLNEISFDDFISEQSVAILTEAEKQQITANEMVAGTSPLNVDTNHPLYLKLYSLKTLRQQNLSSKSEEMVKLLLQQDLSPQTNFTQQFQHQLKLYEQVNQEQKQKMLEQLVQLNQKFSFLPFAEFLHFVKSVGLESFLEEYKELGVQGEISKEEFDTRLSHLQNSENLHDLMLRIADLSEKLNLKSIPDYNQLIAYQNTMRDVVLQKLSQFFLLKNDRFQTSVFQSDGRESLIQIFKSAWIYDPEIVDFYVNEYDLLCREISAQE